ncbi:hypothetical protein A1O7_05244 [Cladophialophora yegresii CBS 114405]|uniref:4-coumarate-CoA ligase n=1 Tax=Cladophialophora yegresii CBS 114405 TaxID=1182544 RepID=W9W983_9EURO|nr:uncharacterized protein A1O7_05244 [Cladophialophora yegresii CBS 114405]EXJ61091.1 hypothetical protein A1O7_05244 [Cladophialophora yegresii CBS 114405]
MSFSKVHPTVVVDSVWTSCKSVPIPSTDILTYTFGNLSRYDDDTPIFIDANHPSHRISAKQALRTVRQLIKGLKALGLKEGECVCLHAFNNIWYPLIWLGIIGSGGRVVGSNPRYAKSELVHLLDLTKPKFVFAQMDCMDPIVEAAAATQSKIDPTNIFSIDPVEDYARVAATMEAGSPIVGGPCNVFSLPRSDIPPIRGHSSWRTLLLRDEIDSPLPTNDGKFNQESIAVYSLTSGTTGLPKTALISHRSIVVQTALLEDQLGATPHQPLQLVCLPVFHAFASPLALVLPLRVGIPTFFLPKWSLPEYLRAVETHAITDVPVCPPIVSALTQLPVSEHPRLKSLRHVMSAGAALPATVQNKLYHVLAPQAVVTQVWGTTEAGWHTFGDLQERDRSGSVGRLLPHVHLKLVSEDGDLVTEEGKPGEAFIKTPMLFSGYLQNSEANADAFDPEGFYRTGDQLYVQDGKLYYTDRIKETMKVHGWQVSPTELESVLIQHPRIVDAAVVGITRNNLLGIPETFPTAYVVRSALGSGLPLTEQEVKDFIAARLISYKRITGDVNFVDQIPRSSAGKILRRNLLQTARSD